MKQVIVRGQTNEPATVKMKPMVPGLANELGKQVPKRMPLLEGAPAKSFLVMVGV